MDFARVSDSKIITDLSFLRRSSNVFNINTGNTWILFRIHNKYTVLDFTYKRYKIKYNDKVFQEKNVPKFLRISDIYGINDFFAEKLEAWD